MSKPSFPKPVKLIVSLISRDKNLFPFISGELSLSYGRIDFMSKFIPFNTTTYYQAEMGENLMRRFTRTKTINTAKRIASSPFILSLLSRSLFDLFRLRLLLPAYTLTHTSIGLNVSHAVIVHNAQIPFPECFSHRLGNLGLSEHHLTTKSWVEDIAEQLKV